MKIVFIVPYPPHHSPSQRFRFEQYLSLLKANGHQYEIHSFLVASNWRLFASPGNPVKQVLAVAGGFARRFLLMFRMRQFDYVFIHREATPIGPPVMEWLITRGLKKKVIYDFDDAIWLTDRVDESWLGRTLRWRSKVATICRLSHRVSCGNGFLAAYARRHAQDVVVNPTTIDTNHHTGKRPSKDHLTIGWTGTKSTIKYLEGLRSVIAQLLAADPKLEFQVIADVRPAFDWPTYSFVKWQVETEIADLLQFDIGVMPLPDDDWSKGKCGFKALQYMALGIPTVASPVGVNTEIISNGQNGLLARNDEEWLECLNRLIGDKELRRNLATAGAQTVSERYSVDSNAKRFLSLFS